MADRRSTPDFITMITRLRMSEVSKLAGYTGDMAESVLSFIVWVQKNKQNRYWKPNWNGLVKTYKWTYFCGLGSYPSEVVLELFWNEVASLPQESQLPLVSINTFWYFCDHKWERGKCVNVFDEEETCFLILRFWAHWAHVQYSKGHSQTVSHFAAMEWVV